MLDYDLSDFEIRDIQKTDGHSELILQTIAQGVTGFIIALITDNTLSIDGAEVRKKAIYESYKIWCSNYKERRTLGKRVSGNSSNGSSLLTGLKLLLIKSRRRDPQE